MASEIPEVTSDDIVALFGSLYAVHRDIAHGAVPLPAQSTFSPLAYTNALGKVAAAAAGNLPLGLSSLEQRSLCFALATLLTCSRHGGKLPWVPFRESDVSAARKVAGASPDAMPSPDKGIVVLDPFSFVPASFAASDRQIVSAVRGAIRAMGRASKTKIAGAIETPSINSTATAQQPTNLQLGPGGVAIITVGAVLVLGWGIYEWAAVKENEDQVKWYYQSGTATAIESIHQAAALQAARYATAKATGKPVEPPTPLEVQLAGNIKPEGAMDRWLGPALAFLFAGATLGAIALGARWAKKEFT